MAQKRPHGPYIWVTTLAKLLSGENSCEWAGWFKAHHQNWTKPPSDFDSTAWMLAHTALANKERENQERLGYTVQTENQNYFRLTGRTATIAGKPDLIAEKYSETVVIDVKTGETSPSHPRAGHDLPVRGAQSTAPVPGQRPQWPRQVSRRSHHDPAVRREPRVHRKPDRLDRRLADETPARRVPSAQECRFCDIGSEDCPVRIDVDYIPEGATEDF